MGVKTKKSSWKRSVVTILKAHDADIGYQDYVRHFLHLFSLENLVHFPPVRDNAEYSQVEGTSVTISTTKARKQKKTHLNLAESVL